jgi:2-polyprenyl-3-methyl-5-hydroxy-6-metoxy-1,4-benzoquinol methylase
MQRSTQLERLDQGISLQDPEKYRSCLRQLGRVGKLLGGDRATLSYMPPDALSFLDVGCGGGHFARLLAAHFPAAEVVGIDIDEEAIAYAKTHPTPRVGYSACSADGLQYEDKSFDVVTSTLTCHHMDDQQLVHFFKEAGRVARKRVVINDLHRSVAAWLLFAVTAPLLFPNRLIYHDGLLSIRRGFVRKDWENLLQEAGFSAEQWSLRWHWAFRWLVILQR